MGRDKRADKRFLSTPSSVYTFVALLALQHGECTEAMDRGILFLKPDLARIGPAPSDGRSVVDPGFAMPEAGDQQTTAVS
jgi:hypothetical protein